MNALYDDGVQRPVEECLSLCFLETIETSEECGCLPVWGVERYMNATRNKRGGLVSVTSDLDNLNSDFKECSFEILADSVCYNFIKKVKKQLSKMCDCKIPCEEVSVDTDVSYSASKIFGPPPKTAVSEVKFSANIFIFQNCQMEFQLALKKNSAPNQHF